MKNKLYIILILSAVFVMCFCQRNFAKYVMSDTLKLEVYLDKTPPKIKVTSNEESKFFTQSNLSEIQNKNNDVIIETSDNIKIKTNQYFYNKLEPNFEDKSAVEFISGTIISDEGYYKIISTDTSLNETEIIILIDKSPPEIFVEYFKKGEIAYLPYQQIRQVAGISKNMATQNIINQTEENIEEKELEETIESTQIDTKKDENIIQEEDIEQGNTIESENIMQESTEENMDCEYVDKKNLDEIDVNEQEIKKETDYTNEETAEENCIIEQENQKFEIEEVLIEKINESQAAGEDFYVGNELEFRNALANQASVIHVRESIDFTAPVYINYDVKITCESSSNALRYGNSGNFIVVQNAGILTLEEIVIDTNSSHVNGITAISIENNGKVVFVNNSIVDGGLGNTGILIYDGGNLLLHSSEIVRCGIGINLQMRGNLVYGYQENQSNDLYWNNIAVYIDNFYGAVNFNGNISIHDNSVYGIEVVNSFGTINICEGIYYNNGHAIHTENVHTGSINVFGGNFYANGWALCVGGSLNLQGGSIYNNYYGIILDKTYLGKLNMTRRENLFKYFICNI